MSLVITNNRAQTGEAQTLVRKTSAGRLAINVDGHMMLKYAKENTIQLSLRLRCHVLEFKKRIGYSAEPSFSQMGVWGETTWHLWAARMAAKFRVQLEPLRHCQREWIRSFYIVGSRIGTSKYGNKHIRHSYQILSTDMWHLQESSKFIAAILSAYLYAVQAANHIHYL
jgi:hypothetical protein